MQTELYWLALQQNFYASPRVALSLLKHFSSPAEIFKASLDDFKAVLSPKAAHWHEKIAATDWKGLEKRWALMQSLSVRLVCWGEDDYPAPLRQIVDPPLALTARGDVAQWNHLPWIGIVGSRKASAYGKRVAFELAQQLATKNIGVISGLAYGIDAKAHEGALAGNGKTWGVMGTGIETIYPESHRGLADKMMQTGGILSEFPLGIPSIAAHFPQRNRIISGMSLGVVVVEAAVDSGSLITARLALEQDREVFAVPGPVGHPLVQGTHQLIKQGAKLVEGAWDIVAEIQTLQHHKPPVVALREKLLQNLSDKPKSIDQLAFEAGLSVASVLSELTLLETEGTIRRMQGSQFALKK